MTKARKIAVSYANNPCLLFKKDVILISLRTDGQLGENRLILSFLNGHKDKVSHQERTTHCVKNKNYHLINLPLHSCLR
ncbi:hypothetical protein, partial [Streptococcus dysgalactiae]|uniref:hypothetical protein n=2 Tax=Streptococcus TaxID=1301 RepID=UPI001CA353B2